MGRVCVSVTEGISGREEEEEEEEEEELLQQQADARSRRQEKNTRLWRTRSARPLYAEGTIIEDY